MNAKLGHVRVDTAMTKGDLTDFLRRYFTEISDLGDSVFVRRACTEDTFVLEFYGCANDAGLCRIRISGGGTIWEDPDLE